MIYIVVQDERFFAEDNYDIEKFFETLHALLDAAWGEGWGVFSDDEPLGADPNDIKLPTIVYDTPEYKPNEQLSPLGARRFMYRKQDASDPKEIIEFHKQWFDYTVRFEIYAATNRECRLWANKLEDLIFTYTPFFNEMGVKSIQFKKGGIDIVSPKTGQDTVHRSLRYFIQIERTYIVRTKKIEEVKQDVKLRLYPDA